MASNTRQMLKTPRRSQAGFTLIEVLVASAISFVIAVLAYGFVSSAVDASQSTDKVMAEINELEAVWQAMATDIDHAVDRRLPATSAGIGSSGPLPAFMGGVESGSTTGFLQGDYVLRMARDGWANPLQHQRSDLQRIGYRWINGELWRDYWAERNQPLDAEPSGQRLLVENLEAIRVRFLPAGAPQVSEAYWLDTWPSREGRTGGSPRQGNSPGGAQDDSTLPMAVEVTLTLEGTGEVQRIFALP